MAVRYKGGESKRLEGWKEISRKRREREEEEKKREVFRESVWADNDYKLHSDDIRICDHLRCEIYYL